MSAKTTGQIWDLDLSVPWRMVLLAMADHADHNGEHMRASQAFIAWKTGYSSRNVARIIQDMLSDGLLILTDEAIGQENEYAFNLGAAKMKPVFHGRKPKKTHATPDKMSGVKNRTPDKMSGVTNGTPDILSPPPDKMSGGTPDKLAIDRYKYHIESHDPSPTPSMFQGGGGGDDDFYRQLRRRNVGQAKARQIASMPCNPDRILHLIDTRPNPNDPNSLGRLITDILDGVAGDYVPPRAAAKNGTPLAATRPNVPETTVAPAEVLRRMRER